MSARILPGSARRSASLASFEPTSVREGCTVPLAAELGAQLHGLQRGLETSRLAPRPSPGRRRRRHAGGAAYSSDAAARPRSRAACARSAATAMAMTPAAM